MPVALGVLNPPPPWSVGHLSAGTAGGTGRGGKLANME